MLVGVRICERGIAERRAAIVQREPVRRSLLYRVYHRISIYAIEKVTVASTHYQFVVGRRLPGEPDAWSEIVPRCSRACWAVTRIPQNAVRQCSSVVCWNNEAGIRARCRTSSRDRHRLNLAQPEVGQIAVLVDGITIELPPQAKVEC